MAITYYALWLMGYYLNSIIVLLFVLFYLNFFIIFGRILGLNKTPKTRVIHSTQTRVYGFENGRVAWVFGYRVAFPSWHP